MILRSAVWLPAVALALALSLVSPDAQAQIAPRFTTVVDAFDRVARGTGALSAADYDAFWKRLGDPRPEDRQRMIAELRRSVFLVYDYNYQKQLCAMRAWQMREVPSCPEAEARYLDIREWQRSVGANSDPMAQSHAVFLNALRSAARRGELESAASGMRVSESGLLNNLEKAARALDRINAALQPVFPSATAQQNSSLTANSPATQLR